jgi:hypothetical protein
MVRSVGSKSSWSHHRRAMGLSPSHYERNTNIVRELQIPQRAECIQAFGRNWKEYANMFSSDKTQKENLTIWTTRKREKRFWMTSETVPEFYFCNICTMSDYTQQQNGWWRWLRQWQHLTRTLCTSVHQCKSVINPYLNWDHNRSTEKTHKFNNPFQWFSLRRATNFGHEHHSRVYIISSYVVKCPLAEEENHISLSKKCSCYKCIISLQFMKCHTCTCN